MSLTHYISYATIKILKINHRATMYIMILESPQIFRSQKEELKNVKVIEAFYGALKELFFIEHPKIKKNTSEVQKLLENYLNSNTANSNWIFYPWKNVVIHTLTEELYFKVRTARNRNIITEEEQQRYRKFKVGIAGLSVGSAVAEALSSTGGPKIFKLADPDIIELTNLNRIKATVLDIGCKKTDVAAKQIWEVDPFAEIYLWSNGLNKNNIEEFILGEPKLDVFIDEMDDLEIKFLSRIICAKNRIPVVMATDNGDGTILDIERYDLDPSYLPFHGLLGNLKIEDLAGLDKEQWVATAMKIIGSDYLVERLKTSLLEIGKTLSGVSQIATGAKISGAGVAHAVRLIANKGSLASGKYKLNLEELCKITI
ncbi:ThiF family adenylyltransferase [Candidatus Giovannonibacteria bacterium]|nr:ThiF family adenylyltransferase [Candidatus Giovannonibacteria bacterium]